MSNLPAIPEDDRPLGIEAFRKDMADKRRVVLPYLKVVQSMSDDFTKDKVLPGNFRNSLSGEILGESVDIVPVGILHWRRRFVERVVKCSSNDAYIGFGDPGGDCRNCPLSWWGVKRDGQIITIDDITTFRAKRDDEVIPPECQEQYVFPSVVLSSEWKIPAALVFQKSSFSNGIKFGFLVANAPLDTVYKIQTVSVTGPKGTWFTPRVNISRKADGNELELVYRFRKNIEGSLVEVAGLDEEQEDVPF